MNWFLVAHIAEADDDALAEARFSIKKHYWGDALDQLGKAKTSRNSKNRSP